MNIVNEEVGHVLYKEGKIIGQEENTLTVQFSEKYGIKKFIYPDAFEKFLKLSNPEVELSMLAELKDKQAMLKAKTLQEQQEYEAALQSKDDEKSKLAARKKKPSAKRS